MRTTFAASVLALLLSLGVAACGSDEPSATPTPSAPSATAPPDLDTTEPRAPADVAQTRQSAKEFAGYFALVVQHAIRIRDIAPVAALARDQAACSSCTQIAAYINGLEKDALWETGGDLEIGRLRVRSTGETAYNVKGSLVYPRIAFVDLRGKEKASQDVSDYRLDVDLLWDADRNRWQVDDYSRSRGVRPGRDIRYAHLQLRAPQCPDRRRRGRGCRGARSR